MGVDKLQGTLSELPNWGTQCCVAGKTLVVDARALINRLLTRLCWGSDVDDSITQKAEFCVMGGSCPEFSRAVLNGFTPAISIPKVTEKQNRRIMDIKEFMKCGNLDLFHHTLGKKYTIEKHKFAIVTTVIVCMPSQKEKI
ncbi:hypothetical protein Pelo_4275 [Pelomyxa schiedti]|nr:hypothetical protein Pelo_4275 [Pelomyxa schiedti]